MRFKTNTPECPECGNSMVSRKGKFGIFWGCIMYPDCKGIRDSEGLSKADKAKEADEFERTK